MSELTPETRQRIRAIFGLNGINADAFGAALMTIDDLVGFPPETALDTLASKWLEAMDG